MKLFFQIATCLLLASVPPSSFAQSNLQICLDGRYPSLCDKSKLTEAQQVKASAAEQRANLKQCLDGRYPSLCKHDLLSESERKSVAESERRANLHICLQGKYPALCRHELLGADERARVEAVEKSENLKVCIQGKYRALCHHDWLTAEQATRVAAAEKAHPQPTVAAPRPGRRVRGGSGDCESGHWIDSVMSDGEIIKLEDGSVWRVDAGDTVDSMLWLPISDVVVCSDKIINTDDNETVGVTRLR
jgi:hypothetical protein